MDGSFKYISNTMGKIWKCCRKSRKTVNDAKKEYDILVSTRKNQLEKPLTKIEEITTGGDVVELAE